MKALRLPVHAQGTDIVDKNGYRLFKAQGEAVSFDMAHLFAQAVNRNVDYDLNFKAATLVRTIKANVETSQLTDVEFRNFIKNCLKVFPDRFFNRG